MRRVRKGTLVVPFDQELSEKFSSPRGETALTGHLHVQSYFHCQVQRHARPGTKEVIFLFFILHKTHPHIRTLPV